MLICVLVATHQEGLYQAAFSGEVIEYEGGFVKQSLLLGAPKLGLKPTVM